MNKIIALMGEAGTGKDTILHTITERYPDLFNEIISYTTRPPRENEIDGVNYHFISVPDFHSKTKFQEFLETSWFNGWGYGTAYDSLVDNKINIGIFNPTGVRRLQEIADCGNIELTTFYVRTPPKTRLVRQLNREDTPCVDEIIRRFSADKKDFSNIGDINYMTIFNIYPIDVDSIVTSIYSVAAGQFN